MNTKMLEEVDSIYEVGGKSSVILTVALTTWNWIAEHISLDAINPIVIFISGIVSLLYIWSKYRGQRLKNQQTELEIRQLKRIEEKQIERDGRK